MTDSPETRRRPSFIRRLIRNLLILAVVLALLVYFAAPSVISGIARRQIEDQFAQRFEGNVTVARCTFSWPAEVKIESLAVSDSEGHTRLGAELVETKIDLWKVFSETYVVDIRVLAPHVRLRESADGGYRIDGMKESQPERDEEPPSSSTLPDIVLNASLERGTIEVVNARGETLTIDRIDGRIAWPSTREPLDLNLVVGKKGAGALSVEASLNLFPEGRPDEERMTGTVSYEIEPLDLAVWAPLFAPLAGVRSLDGSLAGKGDFRIDEGLALSGEGSLNLRDVFGRGEAPDARPISFKEASLAMSFTADDRGSGTQRVNMKLADAFSMDFDGRTREPLAASGEVAGKLTVTGDVGRLIDRLGSMLDVKPGVTLNGAVDGAFDLTMALADGAPQSARLDGSLKLSGLSGKDETGRSLPLASEARLDARQLAWHGKGVSAELFQLDFGPIQARALGGVNLETKRLQPTELHLDADLEALGRQLSSFMELDGVLRGRAKADVVIEGGEAKALCRGKVVLSGFDFVDEAGEGFGPLSLNLDEALQLDLADGGVSKLEKLDVTGGFIEGRLTGELVNIGHPAKLRVALRGPLSVDRRRMPSSLRRKVEDAGLEFDRLQWNGTIRHEAASSVLDGKLVTSSLRMTPKDGKDGGITLRPIDMDVKVSVAQSGGVQKLTADLRGKTVDILLEGPEPKRGRLVQPSLDLEFDLRGAGATRALRISRGRLVASFGAVDVSGNIQGEGPKGTMDLKIRPDVNLATLTSDLGDLFGVHPGDYTGNVKGGVDVVRRNSSMSAKGKLLIENLTARAHPEGESKPVVVREPSVALDLDLAFDDERGDLDLGSTHLNCKTIRGGLKGRIRQWKTSPIFDGLVGEFRYIPDRLGVLLAPWLPGSMTGSKEMPLQFRLDGKAAGTDWLSVLRGTHGGATLGLSRLLVSGFELDGDLETMLSEKHLSTDSRLALNGGGLRIKADVDLEERKDARCVLDVSVDKAQANAAMSPLLKFVNPLFALNQEEEGGLLQGLLDVNLHLEYAGGISKEIAEGGWAAVPKKRISGRGRIGFTNLVVQGAEFLTLLDQVAGLGLGPDIGSKLAFDPIEFTIDSGRLRYAKSVAMNLGGVPTQWTGSVGLDGDLDMVWEIPVTAGLLAKAPFLKFFKDQPLRVPVGGTLSSPKLQMEKVLEEMAQKAIQKGFQDKIGGALGGVLGGALGGKKPAQNQPKGQKDPKAKPPAPAPTPGGLLGGLLGGIQEKEAKKLLKRADRAWDANFKDKARARYRKLRTKYKGTSIYKKNKVRIDERAK